MKEIIHNKKWGKFNCFGIYAWLILGITSCYHKVQEEKNSVNKEIVQQQEKIRSFSLFLKYLQCLHSQKSVKLI